jgi:aldehyde:ferredoxin oxidoreductase
MFGFYNMVLKIDVSQKSYELQMISDDLLRQTLGGKGLATHLLLQNNPAGVDPLGPDNHIIFANGPASGSGIWGSCRHGVFTKSPQTGFLLRVLFRRQIGRTHGRLRFRRRHDPRGGG